jgi:hypothetical protein
LIAAEKDPAGGSIALERAVIQRLQEKVVHGVVLWCVVCRQSFFLDKSTGCSSYAPKHPRLLADRHTRERFLEAPSVKPTRATLP